MRFCSLLSGGKDSNYALYRALREGYEPACILVARPRARDSWMFHVPNVELALLQAEAMGLRHIARLVEVSGVKEREVKELWEALERLHREVGFEMITVGALASRYQYRRIERIADSLGVEVYAPAWLMDQEEYLRLLVDEGIKFVITRISTMGLPHRLLGAPIGQREVEEIIQASKKHGFNPAFEGGEAETLVVDAPHYRARLRLRAASRVLSDFEAELVIEDAWLEWKEQLTSSP